MPELVQTQRSLLSSGVLTVQLIDGDVKNLECGKNVKGDVEAFDSSHFVLNRTQMDLPFVFFSLCSNYTDFDTVLTIQDSDGNVVGYSDDYDDCGYQSASLLQDQDYAYLSITVEGYRGQGGKYELSTECLSEYPSFWSPSVYTDFPFDLADFSAAQPCLQEAPCNLECGESVVGDLSLYGGADFYSVEIDSFTIVSLCNDGTPGNVYLFSDHPGIGTECQYFFTGTEGSRAIVAAKSSYDPTDDDSYNYKLVVACFAEDPFPELRCNETGTGTVGDYRLWYRFDPSVTGVAVVSVSGPYQVTSIYSVGADDRRQGESFVVYGTRRSLSEVIFEVYSSADSYYDSYGTSYDQSVAGESYSLVTSCTPENPCGAYVTGSIDRTWVLLPFSAAQNITIFSLCTVSRRSNAWPYNAWLEIYEDDGNRVGYKLLG